MSRRVTKGTLVMNVYALIHKTEARVRKLVQVSLV